MSNDPFNFSAGGDAPSRRSLRKLAFTQRIVPLTGSKAIATSELANRLKVGVDKVKRKRRRSEAKDSILSSHTLLERGVQISMMFVD